MMKLGTFPRAALAVGVALAAAAAVAQTAAPAPSTGLSLPTDLSILNNDPNVRKATAIVNGTVITGTDLDHRMALVLLANTGAQIPPEEMVRLREQVLRNLVDETIQIQAAESKDVKVEPSEIQTYYARYAESNGKTPAQLSAYLRSIGSSDASIKRQIQGEIAWSRLQRKIIEPWVQVSDDEVKGIIDRLKAARGTKEYKVSEIFLAATPETAETVRANAQRIIEQLRAGGSFAAYARQFSQASTAVVGGDLGWVRVEMLPGPMAEAVQQMPVGSVSNPIAIPGGFTIVAIEDTRQVLVADARDSVLSMKQLGLNFAPGTPRAEAEAKMQKLGEVARSMGGCGGADRAAATLGAEVVTSDQVKVRDLPAPLQEGLLALRIGEAFGPFGSLEGANAGVRVLVLCGRDDPVQSEGPSYDDISGRLMDERVNRRAQRYLRDLRRDAVVDYR
jgi:peptidyl-prolyl cis-trans isomerase SurA